MTGQDTSFNPSVHGWPFNNSGWDEARVYEILGFPIWSTALCGGMALAALDFFTHNINIQRNLSRPSEGDPLFNYIVQRQRDSLGAMIPGFMNDVANPLESHHARWQRLVREDQHLGIIKKYVARNEPIILGLLNRYVGVPTSPENSHHQVLVIGWEKQGPNWGDVRIKIYDPNHPYRTVILVPIEGAGPPLDRFNLSDYDRYVPTWDGTLNTIIRKGNYNFWGTGFVHDGLPPQRPPAWQRSSVSAVARKPGILDLFITGNDGRVYTSWFVEGVSDWSGINDNWRALGGFFPVGAPVSAVARKPGILDLFITGNDGRVYTSWFVEGVSDWSGINDNWRALGGFFPVGAPVSAVARKPGILDLFITGNDGRVYTSWFVEGVSDWSGINDNWRALGGFFPVGAPVSAVARKPGILDLFITGNDGRVYTSWFVEGVSDWSGINDNWRALGGFFPVGAPVSAVARKPGILDLFITGNDGRVYTSWFVEGVSDWSGINDNWRALGGFFPVGAPVSAVARKPGILDLFITGNDGRVYTSWFVEGVSDWSGINDNWRVLGGFFPVGAPVSAVARKPGILDLFITGNDGRVYTSWFVEGVSDWSGINDNWRALGGFSPR